MSKTTKQYVRAVLIALIALASAAPLTSEGLYVQGGLMMGAVITSRAVPLGGFTAGAGYALPLGGGELSLGAEAGFASAGSFAVIPAALGAAYDWSLNDRLSLGAGLRAGGCFVLDRGARASPLVGGRLRAELQQPGRAAALYMSAGLDISPELAGAALLPAFEIGLRLRPRVGNGE
jgi:hypothetical protein